MTTADDRAHYIMIGGFLGAGKSTSIGRFARHLTDQGRRVGLITNDQGAGLVDTLTLRGQGYPVEEIAGGCFCCRFDSLRDAATKLDAASRPDVFLAEPVGSCTDLVATVSYPLRRIYGDRFGIAPLSVVVDPVRAGRILGLTPGRSFSDKVTYVYRKQLEEAQVLVINKIDTLEDAERTALRRALETSYPDRPIFEISARRGDGLDAWFDYLVDAEAAGERAMEIDYQLYGEGEALLGWLNATLAFESDEPVNGNDFLTDLTERLRRRLSDLEAEVAHLKMTLAPADSTWSDLALVNLVRLDFVPELSQRLHGPLDRGELVINLRAEAPPDVLLDAVRAEIAPERTAAPVRLRLEHQESFRPGQPNPTHRIALGDAP